MSFFDLGVEDLLPSVDVCDGSVDEFFELGVVGVFKFVEGGEGLFGAGF